MTKLLLPLVIVILGGLSAACGSRRPIVIEHLITRQVKVQGSVRQKISTRDIPGPISEEAAFKPSGKARGAGEGQAETASYRIPEVPGEDRRPARPAPSQPTPSQPVPSPPSPPAFAAPPAKIEQSGYQLIAFPPDHFDRAMKMVADHAFGELRRMLLDNRGKVLHRYPPAVGFFTLGAFQSVKVGQCGRIELQNGFPAWMNWQEANTMVGKTRDVIAAKRKGTSITEKLEYVALSETLGKKMDRLDAFLKGHTELINGHGAMICQQVYVEDLLELGRVEDANVELELKVALVWSVAADGTLTLGVAPSNEGDLRMTSSHIFLRAAGLGAVSRPIPEVDPVLLPARLAFDLQLADAKNEAIKQARLEAGAEVRLVDVVLASDKRVFVKVYYKGYIKYP